MSSSKLAFVPSIGTITLAVAIIGVSYGASAQQAGFPWWLVVLLGLAAYSGAAEMLFVSVIAAGGAPFLAAAAGILVSLRNGVYAASVGPLLRSGWQRLLGAHLVNDETAAFARPGADRVSGAGRLTPV